MQAELDELMESKYCVVDTGKVMAEYEVLLLAEFAK